MNKEQKFWDKIAQRYYNKAISDPESYQHKLTKTRQYINQNMVGLEFGCGTGGTAILNAPHLKTLLATDISQNMIKIAKSRPEYLNLKNLNFQTTSVEKIEAKKESYDVIFALSLLHLLAKPEHSIQKIHNLLKPGGIFISNTACIADIMYPLKWFGPIGYTLGIMPKINVFSANQLKDFITNSGFNIKYEYSRDKKQKGKDNALFIIAEKK